MHILAQLIDNARRALAAVDRKDRRIIIKTRRTGRTRLSISVTDKGRGFAKDALARVFEPAFGQAADEDGDNETPAGQSAGDPGQGLGLHASAEVAGELGGELVCQSEGPGQGATFTLTLPFTPIAG